MSTQPYKFILPLLTTSFLTACGIDTIGYGGGDNTPDAVPDTTAPTVPSNLVANPSSPVQIDLSWVAANDDVGVIGYRLNRDGTHLTSNPGNLFSDRGVEPNTTYCYSVSAYDSSDNESAQSDQKCATTPEDLADPTAPTNLDARFVPSSSEIHIALSWSAATDDSAIRFYKIYQNGNYIADTYYTPYFDVVFNRETEYCYLVTAVDAVGKESVPSNQSCDTTSWINSPVTSSGFSMRSSMDVDFSDGKHIVYGTTNRSVEMLNYTKNDTGIWDGTETLEVVYGYNDVSLTVDASGIVHIVYATIRNLRYATNASGIWKIEDIGSFFSTTFLSAKIDTANIMHVCHSDSTQLYLKYSTNRTGTWTTQEIVGPFSPVSFGIFCSLSLDSANNVHISYTDPSSTPNLMYVTNNSGAWVTEVVDGSANANYGTSISIDSADKIHISYYDYDGDRDLKYANNSSGSWVVEVLDSAGDVGRRSAIAIDLAGNLHISYLDATKSKLKYATNVSGIWQSYTLDDASILQATSIAIDSTNKVHISHTWQIRGGQEKIIHSTNRDN